MFLWTNILTSVKRPFPSLLRPEAPAPPSDLQSHIPHLTPPPSAPLWTPCLSLLLPLIKVTFLPPIGLTLLPFTPTPRSWGVPAPVAKSFCPSYSLPHLSFFHSFFLSSLNTHLLNQICLFPLIHNGLNLCCSSWLLQAIKAVHSASDQWIKTWHPPHSLHINQCSLSLNSSLKGVEVCLIAPWRELWPKHMAEWSKADFYLDLSQNSTHL